LGYALDSAFGPTDLWAKPHQGHSPKITLLLSAGRSHRRTSGGKAETGAAHDFDAKVRHAIKHLAPLERKRIPSLALEWNLLTVGPKLIILGTPATVVSPPHSTMLRYRR
jgi:hypothetical protein